MTVRENVAYGLKAKKIPRADIKKKVEEALDLVQIASLASRKPSELSGGQQQRVALARAFIIEPSVLLMDEPLSNLDAKLRVQMRTVIKKIQRRLGITTIYVTHDQEEALAISDRIAVLKDGNIMQVGVPSELYKRPDNLFVAGFVGTSNPIECTAVCTDTNAVLTVDNMEFKTRFRKPFNGKAVISIRPEQFKFSDTGLAGEIVISTFLGDFVEYEILLANGMTVLLNEYTKDSGFVRPDGEKIRVSFDLNRVGVYDSGSGELLTGWTT
jgi:iron(III) transport system ATP-binding protein